jgi:hypothetical protein
MISGIPLGYLGNVDPALFEESMASACMSQELAIRPPLLRLSTTMLLLSWLRLLGNGGQDLPEPGPPVNNRP